MTAWYSPSENRFWEVVSDVAPRPDAIRIERGCQKCLCGYDDIFADPMFFCDVCEGTGFPVYSRQPVQE